MTSSNCTVDMKGVIKNLFCIATSRENMHIHTTFVL